MLLLEKTGVGGLCEAPLTSFLLSLPPVLIAFILNCGWGVSCLDCKPFKDGVKSLIPHCVPRTWPVIAVHQVIAAWIRVMLTCGSEHSHPEAQLLLQKQNGPVLSKISGEWVIGLKPQAGTFSPSPAGRSLLHRTWHIVCSIEKVMQLASERPGSRSKSQLCLRNCLLP